MIPRLPFPIPDALKEKEREQYPTLHAFLRAVVVPEMQIKLKQGFGRAIRTETDTCVVAILDERAAKDQRYWKDVLTTLPEMPITQDLHQVEAFIRGVKPDSYFQERTHDQCQTEPQRQIALDIFSLPIGRKGNWLQSLFGRQQLSGLFFSPYS